MTVKELKEKLNQFNDNLIVMIPNDKLYRDKDAFWCVSATDIYQGFNEADGCVFIENTDRSCETCAYYDTDVDDQPCCSCDYDSNWMAVENKCAGCVYEDADGSTEDIGYCVCCSRIVDAAKNDYYKKK